MTDAEKAEARATDPRAAAVIDRCEAMSPEEMQRLHGVLRDPGPASADPWRAAPPVDAGLEPPTFTEPETPWWDPATDAGFDPETDTVLVAGVAVGKGSRVRVRPRRRADAQDLFFDGQVAKVTAVLNDVDGDVHVAVVLVDDPAADLHEWYGRYFYFAPDEIEPLTGTGPDERDNGEREESRP